MQPTIKRIGLLTSGGDAPGMNAAIRAVVRTAVHFGIEVYGIRRGYHGLLDEDIIPMDINSVANIIQKGGTILKSARCKEFYTPGGRQKGYEVLKKNNIDGLVVIGGDGSFQGALAVSREFNIPVVTLAGTIDNDIAGTDLTIGFDTAVNTAIEAIDKIRDTADAHDRLFIVEVMGRDAGYIALHSGMACGAENILIPERKSNIEEILVALEEKERRKKLVNIIVVAEGSELGGEKFFRLVKEKLPNMDTRLCTLGHIQRGGSPSGIDRVIASHMGYHAVECLLKGPHNVFIGIVNNELNYVPLEQITKKQSSNVEKWLNMIEILAA
jgi:6-phosphofructokinase 1